MPKKAEKPTLRIVVATEDQGDSFSRYLIFTGHVYVLSDAGELLNPQSSWDPGYEIADLTVRAQMHPNGAGFYGYRAEYKPFCVDLAKAESMTRVLRRIGKRMTELDGRFGYVQDLPTFMGRLAEALAITERQCFARRVRGDADINGTGYRWMDVDNLRCHLDTEVAAWCSRHGYTVETAA